MCGITGIFVVAPHVTPVLEPVHAMTDSLIHRGPDEGGVRLFPRAALGHRRLKVIDLVGGQQPMRDASGDLWIVYNGEVFNYRELRAELEREGVAFTSRSDTEVVLKAWARWGAAALERFQGQFALAIYDARSHELSLARDRLGIRPLYTCLVGGHLLFASEVKALIRHPLFRARLNPRAVTSYLGYRYPLATDSWYEGVSMVQPGEWVRWNEGGSRTTRYWELPLITAPETVADEQALVEQTRDLLVDAVRCRMIADVPFGAYLSGGLDSSLVTAIMAELSGEPVKTFTIGFAGDACNEFDYARLVADRYATDHHEIRLEPSHYLQQLPELIRFKDAPLSVPNEVPLWVMSRELKNYITVVLSGEGADELFAGYGRIFQSPLDYARVHALRAARAPLSDEEMHLLRRLEGCGAFDSPLEHFLSLYAYTPLSQQRELFTEEYVASIDGDVGCRAFWNGQMSAVDPLAHHEKYRWLFQRHHLVGLLMRLDTTTMATAVEGRVPFVDYRLVEHVYAKVPRGLLIRWKSPESEIAARTVASADISERFDIPKHLLRVVAQKYLPGPVLTRKKVGFPVPLDDWLSGEFGDFARQILLDETTRRRGLFRPATLEAWTKGEGLRGRAGQIVWMLVNFELWAREYLDPAGVDG
jgi:asparagine synthase (glutamine-hydrolysing)